MEDEADIDADETGPERTCIVTREKGDPRAMVRFVVAPDGGVVPDIRARLPGRGAWVGARAGVVELAVKRKSFPRAFKREVTVAPGLAAQVDDLLARDALQALALANKAGKVICGATKVESALGSGPVAALIHASNGSADGVRKVDAAARRSPTGDSNVMRVQIFTSEQLDLALGRANVIHAALTVGGASDAFLQRAARLEHFREEHLDKAMVVLSEPAVDVI